MESVRKPYINSFISNNNTICQENLQQQRNLKDDEEATYIESNDYLDNNKKTINKPSLNNKDYIEYRRQMRKNEKLENIMNLRLSFRHLLFVFILWLGFIASLGIGFLLHFELESGVTASSILWVLSFIFLIFSVIYTFFYCKIKYDKLEDRDKIKVLKYFPV